MGAEVIDRCNLTILEEPGQDRRWPSFSQPKACTWWRRCRATRRKTSISNVAPVYSTRAFADCKTLNALGYGEADSELVLDLVYNPQGPSLPPPQSKLEADYKRLLGENFGIRFNRLLTITNQPISRFGSTLISKGLFRDYMALLRSAHRDDNLDGVMCRNLVSVDWRGYLYDCDFNQMLAIPLREQGRRANRVHLADLLLTDLADNPIAIADHCYACTAGQGSSCGGALDG